MAKTKTFPTLSYVQFMAGVFLLFAVIGLAIDVVGMGRQSNLSFILITLIIALFADVYSIVGFALRKTWWKVNVPLIAVEIALLTVIGNLIPMPAIATSMNAAEIVHLQRRLGIDGWAIMASVTLSFLCLLRVTVTQTRRYARARAEIELASEVHHLLVPEIEIRMDGFEFYGRSSPSAEVGGDLIDVAGTEKNWVAYLADVSGHGVGPGVVMAMVKSAARMLLSSGEDGSKLLKRLNDVLYPLKKPDMFVTFCFLAKNGSALHVGLAGHPAILHFCAQENAIQQLECTNMPLGILAEQEFTSFEVTAGTGDVFALYTDGFLEVANAAGEEFGLARFQEEFRKHATEPLKSIYRALQESVARHGAQFDDQSLLFIRAARPI